MERIYGVSGALEIGDRFRDIIEAAHASAGQRAVILIDEHDKPMLDTMHDEALHESIKSVLRGFFSVLKESDEHIRFAMITGVSKFGKVSIFSGLNNLKDISMVPRLQRHLRHHREEFRDNFGPSLQLFADANGVTPGRRRSSRHSTTATTSPKGAMTYTTPTARSTPSQTMSSKATGSPQAPPITSSALSAATISSCRTWRGPGGKRAC